jgi:hypothetical protein
MKQTEKEKMTAYSRINYLIAGIDLLLFVYLVYAITNIFAGE